MAGRVDEDGEVHLQQAGRLDLSLIGGFLLLVDGRPVDLTVALQRLVALLAIRSRPIRRVLVAGLMWPDCDETRARANLRSALWRLRKADAGIVTGDDLEIRLGSEVRVDMRDTVDALLDSIEHGPPPPDAAGTMGDELLPGWYDDWVLVERERFRQRRLRLLEEIAERQAAAGRYAAAVDAAMSAVAAEPLRETAHRTLMRIHLDEGNVSEALRAYRFYASLLLEHLYIEPSARMRALLHEATGGGGCPARISFAGDAGGYDAVTRLGHDPTRIESTSAMTR